ncbi:ATP-binding cassette domain-containing protein, partial [archaeon]
AKRSKISGGGGGQRLQLCEDGGSHAAIQAANVVQERETLVKSLQMIMGSTPAGYWCATWLWDAAQFLVTWLGSIVVIFVTSAAFFPTVQAGGAVVLLLLLFGIAIPGPTYALSFLFKRHAEAQMWIRLGFTAATVVLYFSTFVLDLPVLSNPALGQVSTGISYVAMLFPPYALAKGFSDIVTKSACSPIFAMMGVPCVTLAPMAWDVAGAKCLYMALSVPVWAAILLFVEARVGRSKDTYASYVAPNAAENAALEDDDVVAERRRVDALPQQRTEERNAHPLLVQHLRKVYPAATRPKVAVADLSAAVEMGEVFGLLGPNGAGKTSTLSMLVGEVRPTSGDAYLHATSITAARRDAVRSIGYCPQFDALFELLTGEENLRYYAAINGVPDEHLPRLITAALQALDLTRYRHTLVRAYSGGNRRRLSLAVAYIAAPPIVFLDECSTGVDPFARRRMFDVINAARHGRSTVMTTHVMEEADGLCTRIGIMVDGRLSCLGSSQHLKAKYGKGYTVEVHLQQPASPTPGGAAHAAEVMVVASPSLAGDVSHGTVAAVTTLLNASAHQVRLLENNTGHLRYEVAELHLPQLFRSLEGARAALGIRDFSVSQTTLESVFLRFSRMQESLNDKHERS